MRKAMYSVGFMVVLVSLSATALATPALAVPEIDGGSIASGIGLLTGGMLMLRSRFGKR